MPWGIQDGYHDIRGEWHETSPAVRRQLRVAMGGLGDVEDPPPQTRPVWFVRHGTGPRIDRPAELVLEDGTHVKAVERLPRDLPLGYHDLHPDDGGATTRLIVSPERCHVRDGGRSWGWAAQLYATRSSASWGIGDFADLRTLARWSAQLGAGYVALNPIHAARSVPDPEPSPYFPSSRRFRDPLYLRIEDVPGFDPSDQTLSDAARAGRKLNDSRVIDRRRVHALKRTALERLWETFDGDTRFDAYVDDQGNALRQYAIYCTLAEEHGSGWSAWPSEHRRADSPSVERFASGHEEHVQFHSWIQWLLDEQLERAGDELALLGDLAVGVDPDGADAWVWRDVLAPGVRIGAPPDEFNLAGQDWGLPPFVPWRLRAARLRADRADASRRAPPLGRAAHRPRHGVVPPVLDPGGMHRGRRSLCALSRHRPARHRRSRERARRSGDRRRRPRHRRGLGPRPPRRTRCPVVSSRVVRGHASRVVPRACGRVRVDPRPPDDSRGLDGCRPEGPAASRARAQRGGSCRAPAAAGGADGART